MPPTSIARREQELYEDVYDSVPPYRNFSPGEVYAPMFAQMVRERDWAGNVLDAGCGTGRGAVALKKEGFVVSQMCDFTDFGVEEAARGIPFRHATLWLPLEPQLYYLGPGSKIDLVYCCDVMEHIPKEFSMLAVARMLEIARRAVFFSISLTHDTMGAWLGRPLHKTIESFVWWRDALNEIGNVEEARDLLNTGVYLVTPRMEVGRKMC